MDRLERVEIIFHYQHSAKNDNEEIQPKLDALNIPDALKTRILNGLLLERITTFSELKNKWASFTNRPGIGKKSQKIMSNLLSKSNTSTD